MQIIVTHDDGATVDITADVLRLWDVAAADVRGPRRDDDSSLLEDADIDAAVRIGENCRLSDAPALVAAVARLREAEAEADRHREAYYAAQRERQETERQAAAQLAAEMREREPHLATWNDAALVRLHAMRNAGMA